MAFYTIDFEYKVQEFGQVDLEADDPEQAELFAREHITEAYPEVLNVDITEVKEIKR